MIHGLMRRLKLVLGNAVPLFEIEASFLLWMLAVGGVAAYDSEEMGWYINYLAEVAFTLDEIC
jgi:hypothetical protein